ncbi:MAG: hypothetical protein WAK95_17785 [Desulfobacterales bacterium]
MFRNLAAKVPDGAVKLTKLHPAELTALLEQAWNLRVHATSNPAGHPDHRSDSPGLAIPNMPLPVLTPPSLQGATPDPAAPFTTVLTNTLNVELGTRGVRWDHLIYAYMIANTRIRPIFRRVVHEFLHGEKFGSPREDTQLWLRNTEELFFRDPPPFSITTVTSHIRPEIDTTERQTYYWMFGMDLNHGNDDNSPYPYVKVAAANKEFVTSFEELLRETWIGFINRSTTSGANPTDDAKIEDIARKLNSQLLDRRRFGNLAREEFYLVAMMSWFHLTLENNTLPIIRDLRAEGSTAEQVLFKIAQMVGLPANGLADHYFQIADSISAVLIAIETGTLQLPGAARAFYDPTAPNNLSGAMNTIITHWSAITGHDVKAGKVAVR